MSNENTQWDIIFMDYNLEEDLNGIELAEKIIKEGFNGTIIFVTGEGGFVLKTKIKLSSIKDYEYIEKGSKMFESIDKILINRGYND
jgi:DNA-binding LytR/AlgR family response regulator